MKKWLSIAFLTLALFTLTMPVYAAEALEDNNSVQEADAAVEYLTVVYGAKTVTCENEIIIDGDFTFLPLQEVLEVYGATLSWAEDEAETKVIITAGQDRCQMVVDLEKQIAYGLDGKEFLLRHKDDMLYLPIHFFVQFVNCDFAWDKDSYTLAFYPDKVKADALKTDANGLSTTHRWIMNLPVYEKTLPSRYSGMRMGNGEILETGKASYYGGKLHGRKTASGERYDQNALTAAHKTLPFGTIVRVTAEWNQKTVEVRITDRGPFKKGRVIDLSTAAAAELEMLSKGVGDVTLEVIAWPY